jgi:F0F1-type ATP synthase assembly protein I
MGRTRPTGGKHWEQLVLMTRLGLGVTASAVAGLALGISLDRRLGTRFLAPILLLIGLGLGFAYAYHVLVGIARQKP